MATIRTWLRTIVCLLAVGGAGCGNTKQRRTGGDEIQVGEKSFTLWRESEGLLPKGRMTIGVVRSVLIQPFNSSGFDVCNRERRGPPIAPGAKTGNLGDNDLISIEPELSDAIAKALEINADPQTIGHQRWARIKEKYPALTHALVTTFSMSENGQYEPGDMGPWLTESSFEMAAYLIDLEDLRILTVWRQQGYCDGRGGWMRPETIAAHHKPLWTPRADGSPPAVERQGD